MTTKENRLQTISAHSHIKGLGITNDAPKHEGDGLVSQIKVRKALTIFHKLLSKNDPQSFILCGQSGTGKSALLHAFCKETKQHYIKMTASQIEDVEDLIQNIRKCINIQIKEYVNFIEGEITELRKDKIVMKTTDMESEFSLGAGMAEELLNERVSTGDVIRINKDTGKITKIGKSYIKPYEHESVGPDIKYVKCPEGEIISRKEMITNMTLHDLDVANIMNYTGEMEIKPETREEVNNKVKEWIDEETCTIQKGVFVIENYSELKPEIIKTIEHFTDHEFGPCFAISYNTDNKKELSSKFVAVYMDTLTDDNITNIIRIKCKEESICFDDESMCALLMITKKSGLKYVINIISACKAMSNETKITKNTLDNLIDMLQDE